MPPARGYHEGVWEAAPAIDAPPDAPLREAFLLGRVSRERARIGRAPRVLDVGCGEGHFASALRRAGAEVVAIDVAAEAVRRAQARDPDLDVRLVEPEAPLPLREVSFDVVWAGETIEHVADTAAWLSELRRVLRSGGALLLSTPDHGLLSRLRLALVPGAFAAHFDPRGDHLRFYTRAALGELLADFGFEDVEVSGTGGFPGARRLLLASATRSRY